MSLLRTYRVGVMRQEGTTEGGTGAGGGINWREKPEGGGGFDVGGDGGRDGREKWIV